MKQISVDLNKLSWSEIETLAQIAKKGREEEVKVTAKEEVKVVKPSRRGRWSRGEPKVFSYFSEVEVLLNKGLSFKTAFEKVAKRAVGGSDYFMYKQWLVKKGKVEVNPLIRKKATRKHRKSKEYYERQDRKYQPLYDYIKEHGITFAPAYRVLHKSNPSGQEYDLYRKFCKRKNIPTLMPRKRQRVVTKKTKSEKARLRYLDNKFFEFRGRHVDEVRTKLGIKYKDAMKILGHYWRQAEGNMEVAEAYLKTSYRRTFPTINKLEEKYVPILTSMLAKAIKDHIPLRFRIEGFAVGIEERDDWVGFVTDFMLKSKSIANYFGVDNKFKLTGTGSNSEIRY